MTTIKRKQFPEITEASGVQDTALMLIYQNGQAETAPVVTAVAGFKELADLTADTNLTYSKVTAGDVIVVGYDRYVVLDAGASSPDATTAGGVKLDLVANPNATTESQSYRNRIINGHFAIWQRGTSQTSSGLGSDDRWENRNVGSTKTHTQQSFTVGQTDVPGNPKYFSRTAVTSSAGASNYVRKTQKIEDVNTLSGETVTVSFYAKADAAKDIAIEFIQYFGAAGSATVTGIAPTTFTLTTSWAQYTATVSIPSISGKTVDDLSYLGLNFFFDAGSDYDSRTNTLGQQDGTFDIALVQVEPGDAVSPFDLPTKRDELAQCVRRFVRLTGNGSREQSVGAGVFPSSTVARVCIDLPVPMARFPDVTYNGTVYCQGTGGLAISAVAAVKANETFNSLLVNFTVSGASAGNGCICFTNTATTDYLDIDAEL